MNWVGTRWVLVTPCSSMTRSASAASNFWRITTPEPLNSGSMLNAHWAEWYTGPLR